MQEERNALPAAVSGVSVEAICRSDFRNCLDEVPPSAAEAWREVGRFCSHCRRYVSGGPALLRARVRSRQVAKFALRFSDSEIGGHRADGM